MRTQEHRDKLAASRMRMPLEEYRRLRRLGLRRCPRCRKWMHADCFSFCLTSSNKYCRPCKNAVGRGKNKDAIVHTIWGSFKLLGR
jgi:hypothetical protein